MSETGMSEGTSGDGVIEFYFDFAAPHAYVAAQQIDELAWAYERRVRWRPVPLEPLLQATGDRLPLGQPLKGPYLRHDVERQARRLELPFQWPSRYPFDTSSACRAFYVIADQDPVRGREFVLTAFHAVYGEGLDLGSMMVLRALWRAMELDDARLERSVHTEQAHQRLQSEVRHGLRRGVFDSPFFLVDEEPFWGLDSLEQVEAWLSHGGW